MLHLCPCVDHSCMLTLLTQMVTEGALGDDIVDLPEVGIALERKGEKGDPQ